MSVIISNMSIPHGCQKCKFFKKHSFGNGLDYSYSCILGAKDFPMPWIRQMEERASDCPIGPLEQEPKTGRCKDCKYFEYDSVAKVDGIPLIVAHEICSKWGDGCKTREDGYCFLFESQESEE